MSPRKLSDEEKTELIRLYRQTDETTATLAAQFHVSNSTVGRVLKNALSSEEYVNLIQRKRNNRQRKRAKSTSNQTQEQIASLSEEDAQNQQPEKSISPQKVQPKKQIPEPKSTDDSATNQQIELSLLPDESPPQVSLSPEQDEAENLEHIDFTAIQTMFGEDVSDDDYIDDAEEEDWEEEAESNQKEEKQKSDQVEVLPFSQAKFPKTCYLVIDRGSNLITKPLKEFNDLGKIPSVETQQKTLPIFDNHRVARRFSNRSQKVIKVPDGKMIPKTREQLEAKGIKRLLMDGKVYMISSS